MTPDERARHYPEKADAAFLNALHAKEAAQRAEYLSMAMVWHAKALQIETDMRCTPPLEPRRDGLRGNSSENR